MSSEAFLGRTNVHPWRNAIRAGALAYVTVLVLAPREHAHDFGAPVLVATIAVGAIAKYSRLPWRWWGYLAAALVGTWLLLALLILREPVPHPGAAHLPGSTLSAPAEAGEWTRLETSAVRAREIEAEAWARDAGVATVMSAEYRHGPGVVAFVGYNTTKDGPFRADLQADAHRVVGDFLTDSDAPHARFMQTAQSQVVLACSEEPEKLPEGTVLCVWADGASLGSTAWLVPGLDLDGAAELTRRFLGHVRRLNNRPA